MCPRTESTRQKSYLCMNYPYLYWCLRLAMVQTSGVLLSRKYVAQVESQPRESYSHVCNGRSGSYG